ncbi:YiiX/YebB-like N1pC/P60 family cysteine hydrolase [Marimonas arenosa]|uniref:Permuted papain-like amidase YaeF/Yiix C92 family enzyme n=1 Tax=Marimonas arenosa TaxID=1795305 RepID=A0AAE3WAS7_9RHOB|nr:YiiX/YebB-like N1pC/P60 family cysteine hydrolase [Marimonas arenosa]MDQ2089070.1 hypothetical protein [Marimonas arenosa]
MTNRTVGGLWRTVFAGMARVVAIVLVLGLAGCDRALEVMRSDAELDPAATNLVQCCADPERYPRWMVEMVEPLMQLAGPSISRAQTRPGFLSARPEAQALLLQHARPFDVMLFQMSARLSGSLLPGHFSHSGLYLGDERKLRAAGLWEDPALDPFRARIGQKHLILDSVTGGVREADRHEVFDFDAIALVRPSARVIGDRHAALRRALAAVGTPFDHSFDLDTSERLFCLEFVCKVLPEMDIPKRRVFGRRTVLPDRVAAMALTGKGGLRVIGYLRSGPWGWQTATGAMMAEDIHRAWQSRRLRPVERP